MSSYPQDQRGPYYYPSNGQPPPPQPYYYGGAPAASGFPPDQYSAVEYPALGSGTPQQPPPPAGPPPPAAGDYYSAYGGSVAPPQYLAPNSGQPYAANSSYGGGGTSPSNQSLAYNPYGGGAVPPPPAPAPPYYPPGGHPPPRTVTPPLPQPAWPSPNSGVAPGGRQRADSYRPISPAPTNPLLDMPLPPSAVAAAAGGVAALARPQSAVAAATPAVSSAALPFKADAYLAAQGYSEADIQLAKSEHKRKTVGFFADQDEIIAQRGLASQVFFYFLKFMIAVFVIVFILQLTIYGFEASRFPKTFKANPARNTTWYSDFFLTNFHGPTVPLFQALNIVCLVFAFACAPIYYFLVQRAFPEENLDEATDDTIVRFDAESFIDVTARYRPFSHRLLRRVGSLIVFAGFIVVQILATLFLTQTENQNSINGAGTISVLIAVGISVITVLLNFTFSRVAEFTTEFEKHTSLGHATRYTTLKRVLFMIANVIVVYGAKQYRESAKYRCVYDVIGEQFLILLLFESTLTPIVQIVSAMFLHTQFQAWAKCMGSINSDEVDLPQFDLANVYIRTLYKLYLGLMASYVFPLASAMNVFGLIVDLWMYKMLLFKLCGTPKRMKPMRKSVCLSVVLCAIVTMATPFAGTIMILSGETGRLMGHGNACLYPRSDEMSL